MSTHEYPPPAAGEDARPESAANHTTAGTLAGFEARLLAELQVVVAEQAATADPAGRPASQGPASHPEARLLSGRAWPPRRLALAGGLTAAVSAGLAVTLALTLTGGPRSPDFAPATTVAAVLNNAALAALSEPAAKPGPDQFVYHKSFSSGTEAALRVSKKVTVPAAHISNRSQTWASVGGTRPGLTLTVSSRDARTATDRSRLAFCDHGRLFDPERTSTPCSPAHFAAILPHLPTTTAGMRAFLQQQLRLPETSPKEILGNDGPNAPREVLGGGFYILTWYYLTPAQQAALFHAMGATPGLTLVPRVTDPLGRVGVGIRYHSAASHITSTVIFDPHTFKPLGSITDSPRFHQRGAIVVPPTIVGKVGQLP